MVADMPPSRRHPHGHIETLPSGKLRATVYAGLDPLTGGDLRLKETHASYEEARIVIFVWG